ncbi:MAG: sodium:proton antiporter [Clostridia bacterium]|nr:sodium:proton antiporter [Clostridia bacterium]
MENAYELVFTIALCVLGVYMFACLVRAIIGPTTADRVISINMVGTIVIMMILLLALLKNEGYLVDIALIYALLSFLAVVLLVRIFISLNRKRGRKEDPHA